jgi:CubicO group peptidase (beta-lactamase class C family)
MEHTMRMSFVSPFLGALLTGTFVPPGEAQELPTGEIRQIAESALADLPGLSVAIGRADSVIWTGGYGLASLDPEIPVTPDTRFRVYSVSKPWTAAAGLRLVAAGRLDPEAPIQIPGYPDKGQPITAFQLATHSSGIRHYRDAEAETNRECDTVAEAVELFADDPLLFTPGTDRSYSTWGFVLLGAVIEQAGEKPFDRMLHAEVLEPSGMAATVHALTPVPAAARPYEREPAGGYRDVGETTNPSCKWGGGGYLSTAADLARFPLAALSGSLLPQSAVDLLFDVEEGPVDRAGGSGPGGSAHVRTDLESGLVIALASNVGGALATLQSVADQIATAVEPGPSR